MNKRLNRKLVLSLLGAAGVLALGIYLLHGVQMRRLADGVFLQAARAQEEGKPDIAVRQLARYLTFRPGDTDALARRGVLLDGLAVGPKERAQVLAVFEQVLARQPGRTDVRRRAARLALDFGFFAEAGKHLQILLRTAPDDGELEQLAGLCEEGQGKFAGAAAWYERAVQHAPARLDSYVCLANLLQQELGQPERATEILDSMIAANEQSAPAHALRARQRLAAGDRDGAGHDAARARALAPDDADALLLAAEVAQARGRVEEARTALARGLELYPSQVLFHLRAADLEARAAHPREAIASLQRALRLLPEQTELLHGLAELLLQQGQVEEAEGLIARLRKVPGGKVRADVLDGQRLLAQRRWPEALRLLDSVCRSPAATPELVAQARLDRGRCFARLGDGDRALAEYRWAVALDPSSVPASLALAEALATAGVTDGASEEYRRLARLAGAPDDASLRLARVLVERNRRLSPGKREWQEAEHALDRAARVPGLVVPVIVLRADVLAAQGQWEAARALLEGERDARPGEALLWCALADLAERHESPQIALAVLSTARRSLNDPPEVRLALVQVLARRDGLEAARGLPELEEGILRYTPADQARLLYALAEGYAQLGDRGVTERLCQQLLTFPADDTSSRLVLFDLALRVGADNTVRRTIADLRRLEGEDGALWRYAEASRLATRSRPGDREATAQARALLAEVTQRRPNWVRVPLLEAALAEREGNPDRALEAYLRALDLGDCEPVVLRRTVALLAERRRYAEADRVLGRLPDRGPPDRNFARLGAEVALRARDLERAVALAHAAVPEASADYRDHLWLGETLAAAGRPDEAEAALRRAAERAGGGAEPWVALVHHLVQTDQADRAAAAIEQARPRFAPAEAPLALARLHEAASWFDRADRSYAEALRGGPEDFRVLHAASSFYLRLGDSARARPLLRQLLGAPALPREELVWARRQLALALVPDADESRFQEALALVESNFAFHRGSLADERARALVLATRPERRQEALQALENSLALGPLAPDEQFRLARLYEEDGDWRKVRAQMLSLLAAEGHNPVYLTSYIRSLLTWGRPNEASVWVARLERIEPDAARTQALKEKVRKAQEAAERSQRRTPEEETPPREAGREG